MVQSTKGVDTTGTYGWPQKDAGYKPEGQPGA